MKRHFLIAGNARTGSTWLLTSLDRLPDVAARRELKWGDSAKPNHDMHIRWDLETKSVKPLIDRSCRDRPVAVLGSKLVFDRARFTHQQVFEHLRCSIEPDVPCILLKRSYIETWLSLKVRGIFHKLTMSEGVDENLVGAVSRLKEREPTRLSIDGNGPGRHYPLVTAVDDLLALFANDAQMLSLADLLLDYSEIDSRLGEVAAVVGSQATAEEISAVVSNPVTTKLDPLESYVDAIEPLQKISAVLTNALEDPPRKPMCEWTTDDSVRFRVPGLRKVLKNFGIPMPIWGTWSPHNPVLK